MVLQKIGFRASEAQHQIISIADAVVSDHVSVRAVIIRLYHTDESPLVPKHIVQQIAVRAAWHRADPVEGGHHRLGGSFKSLDRDLEWFQIDFPDGLLRGKCHEHGGPVDLLVIQRKMLDVCIYAVFCRAVDLICRDPSCQHAVLGIILEVPSCKCGAVGIHGRAVPSVVIGFFVFLSHTLSQFIGQALVPGLCHQYFGRICRSVCPGHKVA